MFFRSTTNNSITSAEHWKNLTLRDEQFYKLNIQSSNPEDELLYNKLHVNYATLLLNGKQSENVNFLLKPFYTNIEAAQEPNHFSLNDFDTLIIPGIKSFAFLKLVMLPYLHDSPKVRYTSDNSAAQYIMDMVASPTSSFYSGEFIYKQFVRKIGRAISIYQVEHPDQDEVIDAYSAKVLPAVKLDEPKPIPEAETEAKTITMNK